MANSIEFAEEGPQAFAHSQRFQDIKSAVHEHLIGRIEELGTEFGRWSRKAIQQFVDLEVDAFVRLRRIPINETEMRLVSDALTKELAGLGPLEDLLADPDVEDILINGFNSVFVSRKGILRKEILRFTDNNHLLRIVRRVLAPLGRRLDESNPMVDARLPDGGRLNVVIEPLAVDGPMVSIRKFRKDPLTPAELLALGSFDEEIYRLLQAAVAARCNILISGGTSSGKTSLLNALANFVHESERMITVEDTAELSLNHPHVVRLESRQGSFEGTGAVAIRDLVRNSLRMRPDRIVVGEVRGAEVLEMLQAMNTGHDGSMATVHANNPRECLYRLEMLAGFAGFNGSENSLRRQIASALDFIVQIGRLSNGKRRILSITEVTGIGDNMITTQELYRHESVPGPNGEDGDRWVSLGINPHSPKLLRFRDQLRSGSGAVPGFLGASKKAVGPSVAPVSPGNAPAGPAADGSGSRGGWFGRRP
ncbi:MAG: CpaF family protein [Janthinobacterium lividum]